MLDKLTETCLFSRDSPKRPSLLEEIVSKNVMQTDKRKAVLNLCKTQWAMRQTAYSYFYTSYVFIVKALEVIAHGLHRKEVSELFQNGWDPSSRARASVIRHLKQEEAVKGRGGQQEDVHSNGNKVDSI